MGSLEFLTPIVELNFETATAAEADAYTRWRDQYQSNWRWAFDPIAIRFSVKDEQLAADLSVMPLIWGSDYRRFVETSLGAEIKPRAGDPHDALLHFVMAINVKSEAMRRSGNVLQSLAKITPLDWLGEAGALYVDDDPLWQELNKRSDSKTAQRFLEENLGRLPIALYCEVANAPKLTLFMAGLRTTLDQVAPDMTQWETLKHGDEPYVKISPTERARGGLPLVDQLNLYYAFWSDGLVVTLNENVLKRALDRRAAREAAKAEGRELPTPQRPWLGESMSLQFDGRTVHQLSRTLSGDYQLALQLRSWDNLPILNEWRRRYPDRNPVEMHEQAWQRPAGLPWRRQVRLERGVANDGIDGLRPSGPPPATGRTARTLAVHPQRQFWRDLRTARSASQSGALAGSAVASGADSFRVNGRFFWPAHHRRIRSAIGLHSLTTAGKMWPETPADRADVADLGRKINAARSQRFFLA